jgi:RNAse (barnase) inhibitor barstar
MAVFQGDDFNRLDWRLLQNGAISLYFQPSVLAGDVAWLANHGYVIHEFDCATWASEGDFHDAVSAKLRFPDYYGRNIAAFNDCLSDLDIPDEGGAALVFHRYDRFLTQEPKFAKYVLDDIQQNSRRFSLWGRRLLALLQSDDPRLNVGPLGACSANWNPQEWLNAKRGL